MKLAHFETLSFSRTFASPLLPLSCWSPPPRYRHRVTASASPPPRHHVSRTRFAIRFALWLFNFSVVPLPMASNNHSPPLEILGIHYHNTTHFDSISFSLTFDFHFCSLSSRTRRFVSLDHLESEMHQREVQRQRIQAHGDKIELAD